MMLTIFKKFIKDEAGSIEIIESTLVYPFVILSISFLFIISIITLNKTIEVENVYSSNRNLIVHSSTGELIKRIDKEELGLEEENLNNRISKFTDKKANIYDKSNIFNLKVSTNIDGKTYTSSKYNLSDSVRKIDFVRDVLKDNNIEIEKFSIKDGLDSLQDVLNNLLSRFK